MTSRYVNKDDEPLRALAQSVGDALTAALDGRQAEVVTLADRRKKE